MRRTMMLGALTIALGLSACDGERDNSAAEYGSADVAMMEIAPAAPASPMQAKDAAATSAEAGAYSGAPVPAVQPVSTIAYSYRYALDLPSDQVNPMRSRHEAACVEAGPRLCQILGSESQAYGDDHRFEIRSPDSGGFAVMIEIPFESAEDTAASPSSTPQVRQPVSPQKAAALPSEKASPA